MPQPNHFAHDMREYFEQHIPFIGESLPLLTVKALASSPTIYCGHIFLRVWCHTQQCLMRF